MATFHRNTNRVPSLWGLVLAGGDGRRLQNYIRAARGDNLPKQYVNFFGKHSMLERTLRRSEKLIPAEQILTVVSKEHLRHDEVQRQLADRADGTVIIQPENRETGPGLLLPLMHLYKRCPEAILAVFPSDHFIVEEDRFMDHVKLAAQAVEQDPSKIVLLAIVADKPEVEYGYIVPSQNDGLVNPWGLRRAVKFVEKPQVEVAKQLVEQGALWNTMIMVFKVRELVNRVAQLYPKISGQFTCILNAIGTATENRTIDSIYRNLEPMNFSKGFLEKLSVTQPDILAVLPVFQVSWSDWGSPDRLMQSLAGLNHSNKRPGEGHFPSVKPQPGLATNARNRNSRPTPKRLPRALIAAVLSFALGIIVAAPTRPSWGQNVASRDDASQVLTVENLNIENGTVAGTVQNRSTRLVRDVQLFIRYTWLWDNETKPGKDDPGTSAYYTLAEPIPPGDRAAFTYRPAPPLAKMAGGHFETSVAVAGFTEVIPQPK